MIIAEKVTVLLDNEKLKIERINSYGIASRRDFWYDSDLDEWVTLLEGTATLELYKDETQNLGDETEHQETSSSKVKTEKVMLKTGDSFYIKAHRKHRVDAASMDCRWLCVYAK